MQNMYDIIIIGGGPAGLAAAVSAYQNGCTNILILERETQLGGILRQCIHNGFGLHYFKEELTGPEYAQRFIDQVKQLNIPYQCDTMVLNISPDKTVTCINPQQGLQVLKAKAIVLAMGCRERPRGALGIPGTRCAGIFSAGTAQKFVNLQGKMPGRRIVILGSGDIGLIMARRLTFSGAKVLAAVEIMPYSSGLTRNVVQCLEDFNIPLLLSHTVTEIKGKDRVEAVVVSQVDAQMKPIPGTEQTFECDTLLLSVGLIPENELSKSAGVSLDVVTAGPVVDSDLQTTVPGIFACGNVLHVHDLVDNVSRESAQAGAAAARFAAGKLATASHTVIVKDGPGVRGLVPQQFAPESIADELQLMFRPAGVTNNSSIVVKVDDVEIKRLKRPILTPGEMQTVTLTAEQLTAMKGARTLSIEIAAN